MKLLLIALLLSSCSSQPLRTKLLNSKQFRVNTYQTGVKCPDNYYYSFKDHLCHRHTITGISLDSASTSRVVRVKPVKRLKRAKIDCSNVFKIVNQCSVGGK